MVKFNDVTILKYRNKTQLNIQQYLYEKMKPSLNSKSQLLEKRSVNSFTLFETTCSLLKLYSLKFMPFFNGTTFTKKLPKKIIFFEN